MKNRVLIVSTAYLPLVGGAEVAIKEITQRLKNYKFDLVCARLRSNLPTFERMGNIYIKRVGFGTKLDKYLLPLYVLLKGLFRPSYDIIWAVMASYGAFSIPIVKIVRRRTRFLLTLQEGDSEEYILSRVGIFKPLWQAILKSADHVQTISKYLASFAREYGVISPIDVIPNGIDVNKLKNLKHTRSKSGDKTVITTSRLVYKNGIDTLIKAVAQLKDHKLIIVGGGPDEQKLKNLTDKLGVTNRVEFIGEVSPDRIPYYLSRASIFARPSRSEGLGSSFLEAMGAGLPIIGTNVGGIPDFLKDGETGLFTKVDDPKDLAEKINILSENSKLREKIIKNGQKLVLENYSWDSVADKMGNVFKKLETRKTVLVATGLYPPEIGGPATYAFLLNKELPKYGIEPKIVKFSSVKKYPKGIRHIIYFFKCLGSGDITFAQDTASTGLPAMLAAKLLSRPFIIRVPGDYAWEQSRQRFGVHDNINDFQDKKYGVRVQFLRAIQNFVVRGADLVITPSDYFNGLVSGWLKKGERKVVTIYNGIELGENENSKPQAKMKKTIISVGRLVPWKGFGVLIDTINTLPDWKLVIVGDGPQREALEKKIRKERLEKRVVLTRALSQKELKKQMVKSEVFVLNTHFESFSFQVVEAMALGIPIVVTNIGSLPEIVKDGINGFLVDPDNKEQIIDAIKNISNDSKLRNKIVKNAQLTVQDFSIEKTIEKFVHETKKLL